MEKQKLSADFQNEFTAITAAALAEHVKAIAELGRQTVENIVEIGRRLKACRELLKENLRT
jgi:hypothetical protein